MSSIGRITASRANGAKSKGAIHRQGKPAAVARSAKSWDPMRFEAKGTCHRPLENAIHLEETHKQRPVERNNGAPPITQLARRLRIHTQHSRTSQPPPTACRGRSLPSKRPAKTKISKRSEPNIGRLRRSYSRIPIHAELINNVYSHRNLHFKNFCHKLKLRCSAASQAELLRPSL